MTTPVPNVGDTVWAPMHDTTGETVTAAIVALDVVKLGCGCHRIHAERPGPDDGPIGRTVNLLTGCAWHPCHLVTDPNAHDLRTAQEWNNDPANTWRIYSWSDFNRKGQPIIGINDRITRAEFDRRKHWCSGVGHLMETDLAQLRRDRKDR